MRIIALDSQIEHQSDFCIKEIDWKAANEVIEKVSSSSKVNHFKVQEWLCSFQVAAQK